MKDYFITIDTETTNDQLVADFAAVVTDRKGKIVHQIAVLILGIYTDRENHSLFTNNSMELWSKKTLNNRYANYENMIKNGDRTIASVPAINRWLAKANIAYSPVLTAYNLAFDLDKCKNTGINLEIFERNFCLWYSAYTIYAKTAKYKSFVLETHAFNMPTELRNMTFKTNAETMARFVLNAPELPDEPHTALEDILFYELPILNKILITHSTKKVIENIQPYNWRALQVKDHFKPANCKIEETEDEDSIYFSDGI